MLVKLLRVLELPEGARVHKVKLDQRLKLTRAVHLPVSFKQTNSLNEPHKSLQEVHGRSVTVLRHKGNVYALDTSCFHQGGPLGTQGEIEDINGISCLRCPWHNYRVCSLRICTSDSCVT